MNYPYSKNYSQSYPITLRNYGVSSDAYTAVINNYIQGIKSEMIRILQIKKKKSEDKAFDFVESLFNMGHKRTIEITDKIKDYYTEGNTQKETAKLLMNQYYKIAVINNENPIYSQPEQTEVTESIGVDVDDPKYILKSKHTSKKLFWLFMNKLIDLDIKFKFNTYSIKDIDNSLNKYKSFLYMESDEVDNQDVIYEFKYSKVLSSFLQFIKDQVKISFFININNNNMLQFGYIKGDKKYELGYYKYTNSDISKLDSVIEKTNSAIDFKELAKGFRWCIEMAYFVKLNLAAYLNKYEGVEYYVNIVRNKFTIIIECDDSDILNISYIKRILKNGFTDHQYNRLDIEYEKIDKKDFYYITII